MDKEINSINSAFLSFSSMMMIILCISPIQTITVWWNGNGQEQEKNQLKEPVGLSFDGEGNVYVADSGNDRIEKFERDSN